MRTTLKSSVTWSRRRWLAWAAASGLTPGAAAAAPAAPVASTAEPGFDAAVLARLDTALAQAVTQARVPGALLRAERCDAAGRTQAVHERAVGLQAQEPRPERSEPDTVYDVASLTKVVATTPVIMRLLEDGGLGLDLPVRRVIPAFAAGPAITLAHLLTHTSGLPAGLPRDTPWRGAEAALDLACTRTPTHPPGTFFRYSDVNFILLGEIAHRVAGQRLDTLAQAWFYGPLAMRDTGFAPLARIPQRRIAPTQWVTDEGAPYLLRGQVHDPTARRMGGVAGHAGIFTTATDLLRYARMILAGGELGGVRVLREATVQRMLAVASPAAVPQRRALGWDVDSPFARARGRRYPVGSVGHTGFTGCALWIDPGSRTAHAR